jgi:hypothetical protein
VKAVTADVEAEVAETQGARQAADLVFALQQHDAPAAPTRFQRERHTRHSPAEDDEIVIVVGWQASAAPCAPRSEGTGGSTSLVAASPSSGTWISNAVCLGCGKGTATHEED